MKLAPIDISHKSFKRRTFGYDADEVSEFLKLVANEMEDLIRERNKLKDEVRQQDIDLVDYKERDKVLRDTIATAQRMSEKVREDSEREAKIILNDANQKADMIVRDARDSLKRVYQEITDIKRSKIHFESNLRALVQSHIGLLESNSDTFKNMGPLSNNNQQKVYLDYEEKSSNSNSISATTTSISPVSS